MGKKNIFNKEKDSEKIALDIVHFLQKWGMWKYVQIFVNGKCYSDGENGELEIREEEHPEDYLKGWTEYSDGSGELKDYSNQERLLDMSFEGPLYMLLQYSEYEVNINDVSKDVKNMIIPKPDPEIENYKEEVTNFINEMLDSRIGWDPAEYDSYEEWLELNEHNDFGELSVEPEDVRNINLDFSTREDYEEFILKCASIREHKIRDYFDYLLDDIDSDDTEIEGFYDNGKIANRVINEFDELLENYGLWYDLMYPWCLTTYRL